MANLTIFSIFFVFALFTFSFGQKSPCGDGWEAYKDEKCFKAFDFQTFANAERTCHLNDPNSDLLAIKYPEEQTFLVDYLFKRAKISDNVWLGLKIQQNKLVYILDGQATDYSHWPTSPWVPNLPKTSDIEECVQMAEKFNGLWVNESCTAHGIVVCEKSQLWSLEKLQQTLLDTNKALENAKSDLTNQLQSAQNRIESLEKNPVPIGFIYAQLSGQPEPTTLWPNVKWEETSKDYAGLFFRVAGGGGAAPFGTVQEENSPRLTGAKSFGLSGEAYVHDLDIPANDQFTGKLWSGSSYYTDYKTQWFGNSFRVSGGEVRPRNQAMRLWKRIA